MTLLVIFIVQMFLGIVLGHLKTEKARIKAINSKNEAGDLNVIGIVANIVSSYFKQRRDDMEAKQAEDKDKESKCCTRSSFNPSGMFERIVLYCMMNCCCKKKQVD